MKKQDKVSTMRNVKLSTTTFHFRSPMQNMMKTVVITTAPTSYQINVKHLADTSLADF